MTDQQLQELIEKNKSDKIKRGELVVEGKSEPKEIVDKNSPEYLKSKIEKLQLIIEKYEQNGVEKLFYSLNRKANEMADLMNSISLKDLDIDDPKSKSFDRLKVIWTGAAEIATSITELGRMAGVIRDNKVEDVEKKAFVDSIAQERR